MSELEAGLLAYFRAAYANLDEAYTWKIPEDVPFPGFERSTGTNAHANRQLRKFLNELWESNPSQRMNVAEWYVNAWGGIRRNSKETIEQYVSRSETALANGEIRGVASWSKILAIRNPDVYLIFDARVSVSLSAIQLMKNRQRLVLFPQLSSRNGKIVQFQKWLKKQHFETKIEVAANDAYHCYIMLLSKISKELNLKSPEELEMILFANAEALVDNLNISGRTD